MKITLEQKQILQIMLGADSRYEKNEWGFTNRYLLDQGTEEHKELLKMEEIGLVKSLDQGFNGVVFWATKLAGECMGFNKNQLIKINGLK